MFSQNRVGLGLVKKFGLEYWAVQTEVDDFSPEILVLGPFGLNRVFIPTVRPHPWTWYRSKSKNGLGSQIMVVLQKWIYFQTKPLMLLNGSLFVQLIKLEGS